ncbi:MAG: single-stranded DNA-binding protein [Patescibacteria group bacterium]|mgnify:CR=1 FL=1
MYLNKVYLIGNLTRDPEVKALPSGTKLCQFGMATNKIYKDKEGVKKEATEYHNIVAFNKLGELSGQYLKKGQQALVEGRLQTRSWDGQDGQKKYRTEIIADNIQFGMRPLGSSSVGSSSTNGVTSDASAKNVEAAGADGGEKIDYPQEEINPDDIPF